MTTVITIFIVLGIIILIIVLLNRKEHKELVSTPTSSLDKSNEITSIENDYEILIDENGHKYKNISVTNEIARRTYIYGRLTGKFWGDLDSIKDSTFSNSKFFDLNIYDADLVGKEIKLDHEGPFEKFKTEATLPKNLACRYSFRNSIYNINLVEPQLRSINFDRKHQQNEGNEVFGIVTAEITGFVLDYLTETHIEKVYIKEKEEVIINDGTGETGIFKTNEPTGNIEHKGNYKRIEYYYSDFVNTYWGNWIYNKSAKTNNSEGCLSTIFWR